MSQSPESSKGLPKDSILNKKMSRRGFLRGAGLTAAAIATAKFVPALGAAAPISAEATSPLATPEVSRLGGWNDLPVVDGEPAIEGRVIMPQAGVLSIDVGMNSRDKNTTVGTTAIQRTAGTYIEVTPGEEDMKDAEGDARYMWTGGNIVLDPVNGVISDPTLREHIYVANNLGNTSLITEADKLPVGLQQLYSVSGEVNPSTSELVASSFINVFDKFGGTEEFSENVANAWGVQLSANETFTEETAKSPLRAWQLAVSIAAVGIEGGDTSELVNVGELAGEKTPISFYRHVNGNMIDVIGRAVNPESDKNSDVFVITRIENDEETGQSVKAVGFTTPEGFAAAYPELTEIAPQLTAMTGEGIEALMTDVASLDQTQVFLAGLNEFAPKIPPTADTTRVAYERVDADKGEASYRAILFSQDKETNEEMQTGEARFMSGSEFAEWVAMPEEGDMEAFVDIYAQVYGLDEQEVREQLRFEQKNDYTGKPYAVILHESRPLMVRVLGQEQSEWQEATPEIAGALNERQIKVYTSVDGAEPYSSEVYQKTYAKFNGLAPSGSFLQSALKQYTIADRFTEYVAEQGESLRVHTSFFHGIIEGDLGANATREMVDSYVDYHIEQLYGVLDKFQDRIPEIEMIFANEPKWKNGPGSGWEESPLYSAYGEEWPVEIFTRLYQAAEQRGYDIGNKLTFMFNDYGIGVDSANANEYTKADMVRQDIQTLKSKIASRLNIAEEDVPMSIGFQGWAAFGAQAQEKTWLLNGTQLVSMDRNQAVSLIATNIDSFADVLDPSGTERPVNATEIGTYGASEDEQAEYVSRWAAGIKQSGRADSIGFWTPLRDPSIKSGDDMSLFDVKAAVGKKNSNGDVEIVGFKPRKAYYELNAALYN